jgi:hypothetical protein
MPNTKFKYPIEVFGIAEYTPMTYTNHIVFIETTIFTNLVSQYLSEEKYRELQQYLMANPKSASDSRQRRHS